MAATVPFVGNRLIAAIDAPDRAAADALIVRLGGIPRWIKIGLELLVRCHCNNVREIPIHFDNRTRGESKLTAKQQLLYVRHLARLYRYKLGV